MFQKMESWVRSWLKEKPIEKLISFMLIVIIVLGYSAMYFVKYIENSTEQSFKYLKEENRLCKEDVAEKDRIILAKDEIIQRVTQDHIATLRKIKFDISERIDSISNEKPKIN